MQRASLSAASCTRRRGRVAAGPWTPLWAAVAPLWGVVVELSCRCAPARARGDRYQGVDAEGRGAERALQRGDRARDQRGRVDVHGRAARPGGAGAGAAGERDAVPARRATPRGVRACARPSSADGWPFLGPLGPGGLERGERPRRVGDHARACFGPAGGRSAAGAAGGDPAGAQRGEGLPTVSVTTCRSGRVGRRRSCRSSSSVVVSACPVSVVAVDCLQAEDLAVLARAVDVVLAAVALDEDEGLPVTGVAARVQVEALACAVEDVVEGAALDLLVGLVAPELLVSDDDDRFVGRALDRPCRILTQTILRSLPVP